MMKNALLLLTLSLVFFWVLGTEGVEKQALIQSSDIVGTWVGLTSDELQLVRLTLDPDETGLLGYSYLDKEPCILQIVSWAFEKGNVSVKLEGHGVNCSLDREFQGVVRGNSLEFAILGEGWKRSASLRGEENFEIRWRRLKAAMVPQK